MTRAIAPSRARRFLEFTAWTIGLALLAFHVGTRAWSEHVSDAAVDAMREARNARTASISTLVAPGSDAPHQLVAAPPDTSTWSSKRIEEYRATSRAAISASSRSTLPSAVLRIPRLQLEVPIFAGTSDAVLNQGGGHIEGTADIETATGNVGIAAHRDGFFRRLKDIAVGDTLALDTVADTKIYRVASISIVDPRDVSVLRPTADPAVTLVTCYPFYHVGPAPKRFIVHAFIVGGHAQDDSSRAAR